MLTFKKAAVLSCMAVAVAVAGCSTVPYAREVKKRPADGGVIALRSAHTTEDRAHADSLMRTNCGSNQARIMEEGEIVIGQRTNSDARTSNERSESSGFSIGGVKFGGASDPYQRTSGSSETTQMTEWQISYQCVASATQPVALEAAPAAPVPVSGVKKAKK